MWICKHIIIIKTYNINSVLIKVREASKGNKRYPFFIMLVIDYATLKQISLKPWYNKLTAQYAREKEQENKRE
jgi:hypothetical protein